MFSAEIEKHGQHTAPNGGPFSCRLQWAVAREDVVILVSGPILAHLLRIQCGSVLKENILSEDRYQIRQLTYVDEISKYALTVQVGLQVGIEI